MRLRRATNSPGATVISRSPAPRWPSNSTPTTASPAAASACSGWAPRRSAAPRPRRPSSVATVTDITAEELGRLAMSGLARRSRRPAGFRVLPHPGRRHHGGAGLDRGDHGGAQCMNYRSSCRSTAARTHGTVEPRVTLADFLREKCGLTGTHLGCEHGACGACTVLLDGQAVRSCLIFAVQVDGQEVTTVEGIASPDGDAVAGAGRDAGVPRVCSAASARRASSPPSRRCCATTRSPPTTEIREGLSGQLLPVHRLSGHRQRGTPSRSVTGVTPGSPQPIVSRTFADVLWTPVGSGQG